MQWARSLCCALSNLECRKDERRAALIGGGAFFLVTISASFVAGQTEETPAGRASFRASTPATWFVADAWSQQQESQARRALEVPVSVELYEMPLVEVVGYLARKGGVPMMIDRRGLEDVGLEVDAPVSFVLEDSRLRAVLELALEPLELAYTYRNGVIFITTPEVNEELPVARIYPVADLLTTTVEGWPDYDSLIDTIQNVVAPDSWEEYGGIGTIRGLRGTLVISQTWRTQMEIESLIDGLREVSTDDAPARVVAPETHRKKFQSALVQKH